MQKNYGDISEYLLIPDYRPHKVRYLKGDLYYSNKSGFTEPDFFDLSSLYFLEFKAHRIHRAITAGDLTSVAREHHNDIIGDFENMPANTRFNIWYAYEPAAAAGGPEAMLDIFNTPGGRVNRVRFGLGKWYVLR